MMNRRKALAAVAGGIIAGPKVARAALDNVKMQDHSYHGYGSAGVSASLAQDSREYTLQSLAKLKRMAGGDIRDEDKNYPTEGAQDPYVPLKSTSDAARWFMRERRREREWKERTIKSALDALDHYDKTGILRTFF